MSVEKIDSIISKKTLDEFDALNSKLAVSIVGFERMIDEAVKINRAFGETKTFKAVIDGTKQLEVAEKNLATGKNEVVKAQSKLDNLYSAEARKLAEIKEQTILVSKANKQTAQETLGLVDAYKKLEIETNLASREARNLAVQYGIGSKEAKEATKRALELENKLKAADASVGRFQRNVGNYSNAINILKTSFQEIGTKLDAFRKSGENNVTVIQQMEKEYSLLNKLVNTQEAGFANATQEIRANQKALLELENAGLAGTQAFKQLSLQTGELKDQVGDLATRTKNLGSDTFVFDGLISAAEGLAGAYGVAQGAAALFGSENEELQKTFVKLQAVMTILQSLQAIKVSLQKEEAAALLLNNAITNVRMATESRYIVVRYAALAAQKLLNFAMSAAGGPILAVITGIGLLLISMKVFASNTTSAAKSLEQYNREMENAIEITDRYNEGTQKMVEIRVEEAKLNGASEKQLREIRIKGLEEQLQLQEELENKSVSAYDAALEARRKNAREGVELTDEEQETMEKTITNFEKISKKKIDLQDEIRLEGLRNRNATKEEEKQAMEDSKQRALELNDLNKAASLERLKANSEIFKMEQRDIADNQKKISEITFLNAAKRTGALKKSLEAERKIIIADREQKISEELATVQKLQDSGKGGEAAIQSQIAAEKIKLIKVQSANDLLKIEHDTSLQILNIQNESEKAKRESLQADLDMTKEFFDKQKELRLQAIEDNKTSIESDLETRVNHLTLNRNALIAELEKERNVKIKAANGEAERQKIEEFYQKKRLQIELETNILILQATIETQEKLLSLIDDPKLRAALQSKIADLRGQIEKLRGQSIEIDIKANTSGLDDLERAFNKIKEVAGSVMGVIGGAIGAAIDKQKNALQEQTEQVEENQRIQIEAVNATVESEEKKAAKITIINARAAAQKTQIEQQQRQLDRRKAEYEKAKSIAEIILNTAVAVVKGLKDGGPFAAVLYGALGAAQLAVALATEIPKFKHGTLDAHTPTGKAIVGDGWKSELMVTPDGKLVETPSVPTVMNVPEHSVIFPDAMAARKAIEGEISRGNIHGVINGREMDLNRMGGFLGGKLDVLIRTIKNKTENHWYPKRDGWDRIKDNRIKLV